MFQVDVKREIDIVSASMDFVGEGSANLSDLGPDNLWIVAREQAEIGGSPRIMNWHGYWLNPVGSTLSRATTLSRFFENCPIQRLTTL